MLAVADYNMGDLDGQRGPGAPRGPMANESAHYLFSLCILLAGQAYTTRDLVINTF